MNLYRNIFKPFADFLSAFVLLVILFPIIVCSGLFLFLSNMVKVFLFQQRPGLNARPFTIIKFKTMHDAYDGDGKPLPDEVRLTRVGRIVRTASLDELL